MMATAYHSYFWKWHSMCYALSHCRLENVKLFLGKCLTATDNSYYGWSLCILGVCNTVNNYQGTRSFPKDTTPNTHDDLCAVTRTHVLEHPLSVTHMQGYHLHLPLNLIKKIWYGSSHHLRFIAFPLSPSYTFNVYITTRLFDFFRNMRNFHSFFWNRIFSKMVEYLSNFSQRFDPILFINLKTDYLHVFLYNTVTVFWSYFSI